MYSEILSTLLLEYDQKKRRAELDLETRKKELYERLPRLQEIETELGVLVDEIFYRTISFAPTAEQRNCDNCAFAQLCKS